MSKSPVRIVVIAASEGGIKAISMILSALPATFPVAIAIVQHRGKGPEGVLAQIFGRVTALRVKEAVAGELVEAGTVYLAPASVHLLIETGGKTALSNGPKVRFARPSADVLFQSVAATYGPGVVAVVLTGGDGDSADGASLIKQAGGTVIAQDKESSEKFSMPATAISNGAVDSVLPLDRIAARLIQLVDLSPID
ncbi:MAG: chemotaxis response regulator containing a CheY-like receiver domain and a methylesterase domain [Phycisphaerales bacterium]|nr:chemotaxis response regulator containing a CheY-like receiver domain and a methylesterase domain [Phycisphaerales bacterium]